MQGLNISSLKKNPSLLPLYFFTALGLGGAVFYTARLALRSTEVTFNKKTNPEPWNDYKDKQYTFYSPSIDYSKLKDERERPDF